MPRRRHTVGLRIRLLVLLNLLIPAFSASLFLPDAHAQTEPGAELTIGGAHRFNVAHRDWQRGRFDIRQPGSFESDTFRLNADGSYGKLLFSAE